MSFLQSLAQANILHFAVGILVKGLVICLLVRVLLSWVLRGQENGVTRFFNNVTAPLGAPFERLIPPISIGGRNRPTPLSCHHSRASAVGAAGRRDGSSWHGRAERS